MTDSPLIHHEPTASASTPRRPWLIVVIAALALIVAATSAAWWLTTGRAVTPDWERLAALDLVAPAGDAFLPGTPWVRVQLAPARLGEDNTLRLSIEAPRGTPVAGASSPRIASLTVEPLSADNAAPHALALAAGDDGALTATASFDRPGWWRFSIAVENAGDSASGAEFHLLLPDPNLNGPGAVAPNGSSPDGEAVFKRGIAAIAGLRTVRFTQWMADGRGNAAISEHAVRAGAADEPAGFSYRAAGGMEAVVIGTTRWISLPAVSGWQRQEGATVVPPAEWGEEYLGATGFTILGEETIDGEPCQLLAFVVPEVTEPRRQVIAWYLWWVGVDSGQVRQEAMVSRKHYMFNHFVDFDAPLPLAPPPEAATPASGTPGA